MLALGKSYRDISLLLVLVFCICLIAGCSNSKTVSAGVEQKLEMAVKYLSEQQYEKAILAYQEVIKIDNKNITAYKGLSLAFVLQEKPDKAEQAIQDGLKAIPQNTELQLALAGLMLDQGKSDKAEAIYKELLNQGNPSLLSYKAYTYYLSEAGKQAEAISLLEQATAKSLEDYQLNSLLAELYIENGDEDKALLAINKSLTAEPNQSDAYKQLAELYKDRWDELIALGDQYIHQNQARTGQLLKLSGLLSMGKYEDLINLYGELAVNIKDNAKVKFMAAQAYSKLEQKDLSDKLMKSIKAVDLKDGGMLANLANFYLESGDKENARKIAMQGITADDTVIDNYIVMFKLDGGEKQAISKLWLIKYIINNMKGFLTSIEDISLMGIDYRLFISGKVLSKFESTKILEKVMYTPEQINKMKIRGLYMWRPLCYLSVNNGIAYVGYVFGPNSPNKNVKVMGWSPSVGQTKKPVLFKIHHPHLYGTNSVLGELKSHFEETFSDNCDFNESYGQYKQAMKLNSFWYAVYEDNISMEEHLDNAGIARDSVVFVDIN